MNRILEDKTGEYDLSHVIAIVRVPWQEKSGGQVLREGETARLILAGGHVCSTVTEFNVAQNRWRALKAAERHPIDAPRGVTVDNDLPQLSND